MNMHEPLNPYREAQSLSYVLWSENGARMRVPRNPPLHSTLGSSKLHTNLRRKSKRVLLRLYTSGQTYFP